MKKHIFYATCALLLAGCAEKMPEIVEFPYYDANLSRPSIELTQVERTDTSTVLTLVAMYDYYDVNMALPYRMFLTTGNDSLPLLKYDGIEHGLINMRKGVPTVFTLTFPALPANAKTVDLMCTSGSEATGYIWGIDLTGKRSAQEYPADIPEELLTFDYVNDTMPGMITDSGTATINLQVAAWRSWMPRKGDIYVNTTAGNQEHVEFTFDNDGKAIIKLPLQGTACVGVFTPINTYALTYVAPGETMDMYLLPNNPSEAQRFHRPGAVTNGKYRQTESIRRKLLEFYGYADTLLLDKTDRDEYFAAMLKIHDVGMDSLKARNFPPLIESTARAWLDRTLMFQTAVPDRYIDRDLYARDYAKPDSVSRFTTEQLDTIRRRIDFTNPILELKSVNSPDARKLYLKADTMIRRL